MKPSSLVHLCWALTAIIAFVVGSFSTGQQKGQVSLGHTPTAVEVAEHSANNAMQESDGGTPYIPAATPLTEPLTGAAACGQVMEALSKASRSARMHLMAGMLDQITSDNWLDVVNAWNNLLSAQGPLNEEEWSLLLERVGEVAGADAMTNAQERKKNETLSGVADAFAKSALKGWAARSPKEAVA